MNVKRHEKPMTRLVGTNMDRINRAKRKMLKDTMTAGGKECDDGLRVTFRLKMSSQSVHARSIASAIASS